MLKEIWQLNQLLRAAEYDDKNDFENIKNIFKMKLTKDTYEYVLNFADDKDVINMLSVNKKFRNEEIFKKIMKKRYPLLLYYKTVDGSYQALFIEMIFYISKLKEEFGIPYIPTSTFNPRSFYLNYKDHPRYIISVALEYASLLGRLDLVNTLMKKGGKLSLREAARGGHLDIVKMALETDKIHINEALYTATVYKHLNIVKFLVEKGATDITIAKNRAKYLGHVEIFEYLKTF